MNKRLSLCIFLVLYSSMVFSCDLKVGLREMPPYSYMTELSLWQGDDVALFKALAKSIQCEAKFVPITFAQGLRLLKSGDIDAMSQLSKIESRLNSIHFIGPLRAEQFSLITTNEVEQSISELKDIRDLPYLFAKRKDTYLGKEFNALYQSDPIFADKFIEINNNIPRYELALKGRVIGYFEEVNYKNYQFSKNKQINNLKEHPLIIDTGNVFIGLSKKSISKLQANKMAARFNELKAL